MTNGAVLQDNTQLAQHLATVVRDAGLNDAEPNDTRPMSSGARRGVRRYPGVSGRLARVSLVNDDGVLRWIYDVPSSAPARRRMRRATAGAVGGTPVYSFNVRELKPNQLVAKLEELDQTLTPNQGLRRLDDTGLAAAGTMEIAGDVLLLVHGTFSKSDMFLEEFSATPEGQAFLKECRKRYKAILAFDHPTLSVSPWLNAVDLQRALPSVRGKIDIICHSRGGLVVAWLLATTARPVRKVVFVGTPLEGTSLAAPDRLKSMLDLLSNVANGMSAAASVGATVVPLLTVAAGLMKILGGLLNLGARTPLLDAGITLVPGLSAQSRVSNNLERQRLFAQQLASTVETYAIIANYEPDESREPLWKFWRRFRNIEGQAADWATDAIFDGPNDLVVDTESMTASGNWLVPKGRVFDYQTQGIVHHCNYFRQPSTVDFLRRTLAP